MAVVSNTTFTVEYSYSLDRLDSGYTIMLTNGNTITRTLERDAYRRTLITSITNTFNAAPVNHYNYGHDALGRIISRNTDSFGYNPRSEVVEADLGPDWYYYFYDEIGNQEFNYLNVRKTTYTANNLNQYTQISAPSVPLRELIYDLDGNLITNGVLSYTYDSANRLCKAFSNSVCILENRYDPLSRRVQKITPTATHTYFYDGWNLIQETIENQQSTITNRYIWGKDLSGTLQGAGGVGGLLAVSLDGTYYFPLYDNNGNITAYIDSSGVTVATYTYDAFGRTIDQSGTHATTFSHRFSTKYYDPETGLYYYGYRFYSPDLMRWLNRDPIEEGGGLHLYEIVDNNSLNKVDYLGMASVPWEEFALLQHFDNLREELKKELKALCPKSATAWKQYGVKKKCCRPEICKSEAEKITEIYINSLKNSYKIRNCPGGLLGNYYVYIRGLANRRIFQPGFGETYPDDEDVGYTCGGWTDMGEKVLAPIIDNSECWMSQPERGKPNIGHTILIKMKILGENYSPHMWISLRVMDGHKVHLDPWASGGGWY